MNTLFESLFRKLLGRWEKYQDAPRDPHLVTELAAARADLDDTRIEIAKVRARFYPDVESTKPSRPGVAVDPDAYQRARMTGLQDSA